MQFLFIFGKTWRLRMSKTLNKEKMRCPRGFFEEIKAIGVEKKRQNLTEIDRNTKFQILKFLCSFCVILENLGGLEFQKRSTRNKLVFRKAFSGNKRSFVRKKKRTICDQK